MHNKNETTFITTKFIFQSNKLSKFYHLKIQINIKTDFLWTTNDGQLTLARIASMETKLVYQPTGQYVIICKVKVIYVSSTCLEIQSD